MVLFVLSPGIRIVTRYYTGVILRRMYNTARYCGYERMLAAFGFRRVVVLDFFEVVFGSFSPVWLRGRLTA